MIYVLCYLLGTVVFTIAGIGEVRDDHTWRVLIIEL